MTDVIDDGPLALRVETGDLRLLTASPAVEQAVTAVLESLAALQLQADQCDDGWQERRLLEAFPAADRDLVTGCAVWEAENVRGCDWAAMESLGRELRSAFLESDADVRATKVMVLLGREKNRLLESAQAEGFPSWIPMLLEKPAS